MSLHLLLTALWPHFVTPAVFLLLFTLPPFPSRRLVYIVTFISTFYLCFFSSHASLLPSESTHLRAALALSWMGYLDWLAKMVLHHLPEHDFWRTPTPEQTHAKGRQGVTSTNHIPEMMAQPYNWRRKLAWAVSLLTSFRGAGWNFQIAHGLRKRKILVGRWRFVTEQITRMVALTVFSDLVSTLLVMVRDHPLVVENAGSIWLNWNKISLVPLIAVGCWADSEVQYAGFNIFLVGLGLADEKDCRPLFGNNLTSLDSLQEFWGVFWHQNFRRMFQDFGRAACRMLHIHRHTQISWLVQVWVSFIISGAVHGFAFGYALADNDQGIINKHFEAIFTFFILQAVGLTFETLFLDTPVKDITLYEVGLEDEMIMGRIWTWGWLLLTTYYALDSWLEIAVAGKSGVFPIFAAFFSNSNLARVGWYLSGDGGLLE